MKQTILHYLTGQDGITETLLIGFYLVLLCLFIAIFFYSGYIIIRDYIKLSKRNDMLLDQGLFRDYRETSPFSTLSSSADHEI